MVDRVCTNGRWTGVFCTGEWWICVGVLVNGGQVVGVMVISG